MRRALFLMLATALWSCATKTPGQSFEAVSAYRSGIDLGRRGELQEAVTQLETAVKLEPAFPEAWFNLAVGYEKLKEWDHALFAYSQAISLDANFFEARLGFADRLFGNGLFERALDEYKSLLALDPNQPSIHYHVGLICDSKGQGDEALKHVLQTVEQNPFHFDALFWLGKTHSNRGELVRGLGYFLTAHSVDPGRSEVWEQIVRTLLKIERYTEAEDWLKLSREKFRNAPWIKQYQRQLRMRKKEGS